MIAAESPLDAPGVYLPSPEAIREACDAILAADTRRSLMRRRGWFAEDDKSGAAFYSIPECRNHCPT